MPDLMRSLLRRWPITLVAIVITAGLCFAATVVVAPEYEAEGSVVLVPASDPGNPDGNRFLLLGGLTPGRDILLRSLVDEGTRQTVLSGVDGADYEVDPDFTTSAPFVLMTATASSPAAAATVLDRLMAQVPVQLEEIQDSLDTTSDARITPLEVSRDQKPERVAKKQLRAVVAAGGLSLVLSVIGIGLLDSLLSRRRRQKSDEPRATGRAPREPAKSEAVENRNGLVDPGPETERRPGTNSPVKKAAPKPRGNKPRSRPGNRPSVPSGRDSG